MWVGAEAYSEPCLTSKMQRFVKIVNGKKSWNTFLKRSILDVWQGYGNASGLEDPLFFR